MIKALWLTSWYPNRLDAMNGDFIQRHARATAIFCKVDVIHLEAAEPNQLKQTTELSASLQGNLSETIVLYKHSTLPLFSKLFSFLRYYTIFKKQVKQYIAANGKPDIVHVHVPMKAGIIALWLKRRYDIAFVVTEHWAIYNSLAADAYPKRNFIFKFFTQKILKDATAFLPVSKNLGQAVQQMVSAVSYRVIPNVADTLYFNHETTLKPVNIFRFIHVSTLKYQKNPEGILRVFAKFCSRFPYGQLLMVGGNNDELIRYAQGLGIPAENIAFCGLLQYKEVAAELKHSHALLMFSRFENSPCVIVEALCCGLPVISTNVGGIAEMVDDKNGLLVNNEDEEALYNAMLEMYKGYKNFNCREIALRAQNTYSYPIIGEKIAGIYKELCNTQDDV